MSSSVVKMDLFAFPKEVLCEVILHPLPPVDLYRFSRVSKNCLLAVGEVAKLTQSDISLIATVKILKGGEKKKK